MHELKFYKYSAIFLLIINLLLLAFIIVGRPDHPRPIHQQKRGAKERLNLDNKQHEQFLAIAKAQETQMADYDKRQVQLLQQYFKPLYSITDTSNSDIILQEFFSIEKDKIVSIHAHFQEVKSLLNKDQYDRFNQFTEDIISRLLIKNEKRSKRPKDLKK